MLVADSHEALHAYLHGDAHPNVWMPLIKPNLEDIVVFDHNLPMPFTGVAGSQALSLLLKLPPRVDSEQEASGSSAAMQLVAGVSNVYFAPHGGGGLDKAALIGKLDWPDKSQGAHVHAATPPYILPFTYLPRNSEFRVYSTIKIACQDQDNLPPPRCLPASLPPPRCLPPLSLCPSPSSPSYYRGRPRPYIQGI